MRIDDQTLAAYVEGDLDPLQTAEIELAAGADAVLAERIRRARNRPATPEKARVERAEPVTPVDLASVRARRKAKPKAESSSPSRSRQWIAAAVVVVVLGIGLWPVVMKPHPGAATAPDIAFDPDGLVAKGALETALTGQLSAGTPRPIRITGTIRAHDRAWCRSFATPTLDGVACREGGRWRLRATASGPDSTRKATISAAAEVIGDGHAIDAAAEGEARAKGWVN
jgi:hypothetical protein